MAAHINSEQVLSNMTPKYDSYSGSSQSYEQNVELRTTTLATIEADISRAFGTSSEYGQSLGINFEDVEVTDGGLYYDPEKDYYKLFSWEEITGFMPSEMAERGNTPTADDADDILNKSYFGEQKTYELIGARVPEGDDWEASSKVRELEGVDDGVPQFSDFEDLDGEPFEMQDIVTWWDGTDEYGPSASATALLEKVTLYGSDSVVDSDDIHNWLPDTSGEDILRDDLEGRRLEFFVVPKESSSGNTYYSPVLVDIETGEEVQANNRGDGGGSGNASSSGDSGGSSESQLVADAQEKDADARDYPEPVADFLRSAGGNLALNEERAGNLLDDLMADEDNTLTSEMVEEVGGKDHLVEQVTE